MKYNATGETNTRPYLTKQDTITILTTPYRILLKVNCHALFTGCRFLLRKF